MSHNTQEELTIKCRCPAESFTLRGLPGTLKFVEFQMMVQEKTGIEPRFQLFKSGFPPMPLPMPSDTSAAEIGTVIPRGVILIVDECRSEETSDMPTETAHQSQLGIENSAFQSGSFPILPSSADSSSEFTASLEGANGHLGNPSYSNPDEDLDRAIALSLSEVDLSLANSVAPDEFEPGPVISFQLSDGTSLVRRFVDSDNSCLFTAVAYVMEGNRLKGFDLRGVIAATVRSDVFKYNQAFLGRPNEEYCEWIINPQHWGGEIELLILSQYYKKQIATYDIQTTNCYVYGSDAGFSERVMLVYDGIHYDALARSPYKDAPEELDVTIYDPLSDEGHMITEGAVSLVMKFNATNQFTNTATFQLRCDDCGRGFTGASPAMDHQRVTGHCNFSEYR